MRFFSSSLFSQSTLFVFFEIINKGLPFLLLPVFTRFLSQEDFGVIATFMVLVNAVTVFVGVNAHGVVQVNYFKMSNKELRLFIGNVLFVLIVSFIVVIGVFLLLHDALLSYTGVPGLWIYIAVCLAAMQFVTTVNLILWQVERKALYYGAYQFLQTILNVFLSLFLVIYFSLGWDGRLYGYAIAIATFSVISLIVIQRRKYLKFRIDYSQIKEILKFGIPLMPHGIAGWLRSGVDRIFITTLIGLGATGSYYIGFQVGMMIGLFAHAFNKAFVPYLFSQLESINDQKKISIVKFTYGYFAFLLLSALVLGWLSDLFLVNILGDNYRESASVVYWVALGFCFDGMYLMVVNYVFYEKKTRYLGYITIFTSIVHVLLSYYLIGKNGLIGAGQATAFSYFLNFVMVWVLSAKVYSIPWIAALKFNAIK